MVIYCLGWSKGASFFLNCRAIFQTLPDIPRINSNQMASEILKILCVDDNEASVLMNRHILELYCQSLGTPCMFTTISNPYSALEVLESSRFHFCFLKYSLSSRSPSDFNSREFVRLAKIVAPAMPFIAVLSESQRSLAIPNDGFFNVAFVDRDWRQVFAEIFSRSVSS